MIIVAIVFRLISWIGLRHCFEYQDSYFSFDGWIVDANCNVVSGTGFDDGQWHNHVLIAKCIHVISRLWVKHSFSVKW